MKRRAWLVWGLAVLAYAVAVFQRGSLGVASLEAQHRLSATTGDLSLFVGLQLAVYAGMQVPAGVALDRFGSRRMIATGGVVMAVGQMLLALAHGVGLAVAGRVLVGAGDAATFISVLRLIAHWFPPRQAPFVTQLTAFVGQFGQVAAAYPLIAILKHSGWEPAFLGAAIVGVFVAIASLALLRDAPAGHRVTSPNTSFKAVVHRVKLSLHEPGTGLGFWSHFSTQFPANTFLLLWGYPYLVDGEHRSTATAGLLLTLIIAVSMFVGPVIGRQTGRRPNARPVIVLSIVGASALMWTIVIAVPTRAPIGLLIALCIVLGTNSPASMVGLDFARTHNPVERIGTSSGIVNMGGFIATLITLAAIGAILGSAPAHGSVTHSSSFDIAHFRAAFAVQYAVWLVGTAMVLRLSRRVSAARTAAGL